MSKKGVVLVFLTALISGIAIFLNAFGVRGIDSSIFTFSKNVLVAVFLLSIIGIFGQFKEIRKLSVKSWLMLALIGFVGGSIPFLLFFRGLQLATGPTSAFIHKTLFIYAAVLAFIFLKEKLNWKMLILAGFILLGNFLLLEVSDFSFGKGELLVLAATLFWATENIISKYTLRELSGNLVAFGRMVFGSFFILIFLFFTNKASLLLELGVNHLAWILVSSVILLLFVVTYYNGLKTVNVSTATTILLMGSPITLLLNFLFIGEKINPAQLIGIFLVFVGASAIVYIFEKVTIQEEIISQA